MASSSDQVSNPAITGTSTTTSTPSSTAQPTDVVPVAHFDAMPPPPAPMAPSAVPVPPDEVPPSASGVKKSKGRGKIEMKKMEKENNMLVTFSKRKTGLFKKANELCTLCGAECALVVFSPARKVFSFGHPSVHDVVDRYLSENHHNPNPDHPPPAPAPAPNQVPQNPAEGQQQGEAPNVVQDLSDELNNLMAALEASRQNGETLEKMRASRMAACWWARPVSDMEGPQLDALRSALLDLKGKVYSEAELLIQASASRPPVPAPFQGAGPSTGLPPFGGFPGGTSNYGPDEAGPSGGGAGSGGGFGF